MMSYGDHSERAWHLDDEATEPIVRRAVESGRSGNGPWLRSSGFLQHMRTTKRVHALTFACSVAPGVTSGSDTA
jgi:hypothetical protein